MPSSESVNPLGDVIAEQVQKVTHDGAVAWESVLKLHVKPRPSWMPNWCWERVIRLVLVQSEQRR